jgi:hypothetical protein
MARKKSNYNKKKNILRTKRGDKRGRKTKRRRSRKQGFKTRTKRFFSRRLRGGSGEGDAEKLRAKVLAAVQAAGLQAIATVPTVPKADATDAAAADAAAADAILARRIHMTELAGAAPGKIAQLDQQRASLMDMLAYDPLSQEQPAARRERILEEGSAQRQADRLQILEDFRTDQALAKAVSEAEGTPGIGTRNWNDPTFGDWELVEPAPEPEPVAVPAAADQLVDDLCDPMFAGFWKMNIDDYILTGPEKGLAELAFNAASAAGFPAADDWSIIVQRGIEVEMMSPIPGSDQFNRHERKQRGSIMSDEQIRRGLFLFATTPEMLDEERREISRQGIDTDMSPLYIYSETKFISLRDLWEKNIKGQIKEAVGRGADAREFAAQMTTPSGTLLFQTVE